MLLLYEYEALNADQIKSIPNENEVPVSIYVVYWMRGRFVLSLM